MNNKAFKISSCRQYLILAVNESGGGICFLLAGYRLYCSAGISRESRDSIGLMYCTISASSMEYGLFIIAHIAALLHASSSLGPFTTSVICNAKSALSVHFSPSLPDTLRLGETPPRSHTPAPRGKQTSLWLLCQLQ